MTYKKPNLAGHSDTDRKNSWYWSVVVKKHKGNWKKAKKEIYQSMKRVNIFV